MSEITKKARVSRSLVFRGDTVQVLVDEAVWLAALDVVDAAEEAADYGQDSLLDALARFKEVCDE